MQTTSPRTTSQNENSTAVEQIEHQMTQNSTFLKCTFAFLTPLHLQQVLSMNLLGNLKYLDLTGNLLGDEGCILLQGYLSSQANLNFLNLSCNNITHVGVEAIVKVLLPSSSQEQQTVSNLQHLDLSMNLIGYEGLCHIVELLKRNQPLVSLNIRGNKINSERGLQKLLEIAALAENNLTITDVLL